MYFIARSMGLCASDLAQKYSFLTSPSGDAGPPFYVVIQAMWMCSRGGQIQNLHWGGVYMRKLAPARVSHWDDFLISYRVYMMTGSFHILLFNGTFHVDKIHVWFKIANITHALPVPVYRQTDFTPKRVVVSRLHDTVARFRTGVKFSPRCENRGELTSGWLAPA